MKTASRLAIVGWLVLAILGRAEAAEYRDSGTTVAAGCPPLRATAVPGNGLLLTQVPVGDPQSEGHPVRGSPPSGQDALYGPRNHVRYG